MWFWQRRMMISFWCQVNFNLQNSAWCRATSCQTVAWISRCFKADESQNALNPLSKESLIVYLIVLSNSCATDRSKAAPTDDTRPVQLYMDGKTAQIYTILLCYRIKDCKIVGLRHFRLVDNHRWKNAEHDGHHLFPTKLFPLWASFESSDLWPLCRKVDFIDDLR